MDGEVPLRRGKTTIQALSPYLVPSGLCLAHHFHVGSGRDFRHVTHDTKLGLRFVDAEVRNDGEEGVFVHRVGLDAFERGWFSKVATRSQRQRRVRFNTT